MTNQNEIIAQFMGIERCDRCVDDCGQYKFGLGNYCKPSQMQYHFSWSWLMPVVEKICNYQYPIEDDDIILDYAHLRTFGMKDEDTGFYMVRFNRCQVFIAGTLIDATYAAVVDFITWFNSLTQNK